MIFKRLLGVIVVVALCCVPIYAQEVSGYVSGMPSVIVQQPAGQTWWQMVVHNRLNFGWQLTEYWRVDAGVRNRILMGSQAMINPESIGFDTGWADLSWNWMTAGNERDAGSREGVMSLAGNTAFDRLNLTFEKGNVKVQAGRQRINWGQTFVWNANDLFNTYSFFDFDYPERPGCDAIRGTYYHNATSSSEVAVSVNHWGKITAAALHRWNRNGVDWQIIAGEQAQTDLVAGGAMTTDFNGLNLRTEFAYFHPVKNFADTSGLVALSVGADYIFSNSLMLQTELLYNNVGASGGGLMDIYAAPLSAKRMSICNWNLFANASYPITPRLNGSLSGIYFIDVQSCYMGLSLDCSLSANLDFSFVAQYFSSFGRSFAEKMHIMLGFARLNYSF